MKTENGLKPGMDLKVGMEIKPGIEIGGFYLDGRPLVKCCTHLRCKSLGYSGVERPGLLHLSDVMTYWCNHTQTVTGCDGRDAEPEACQAGRGCCEMESRSLG